MTHSRFSSILESLDKTIHLQEEFNQSQSMNNLSELKPVPVPDSEIIAQKEGLIRLLHETLKQHKNFVEIMPLGLMIHRDGKVIYTNPEFRRLHGYEKSEELYEMPVMSLIAPEFQSDVKVSLENMNNQVTTHVTTIEAVGLKKNGGRVNVEAEAVSVIHEGEPAVVVIVRDITQRIKNQEEFRKSEENFQNIIQEMPYGVLIVNENQILFVNDSLAGMLDYDDSSEMIGHFTEEFVHPDYRALSKERIGIVFRDGGKSVPAKFKLLGKDDKIIEVESSVMAIEFNKHKAVMAVIRDITIQNQMERQAALNDKLATVGTLAAGVAHEVNNPLTYVLGNLAFLKEHQDQMKFHAAQKGQVDPEYQKLFSEMNDEVNDCIQGGERIRDIVKGLKAFVRNSEDKTEKVSLNQMVESALNMTYHVFKHKARLEKDLAVDLPLLMLHTGKIQQVFINLIINAAQAIEGNSPERNKIHIRTGRENSNLFVEFTDTGAGIPEAILTRIFDPFFTTKPVGVGTGLGLSVCNEILRQYQGSLEVQSKVDVGTTFTVRLPLEDMKQEQAEQTSHTANFRCGRVLVVDDEPGNLDIVGRALNKKHDVLLALSGNEAMMILEKQGDMVDAIVSDVNMPEMSGISFYQLVAKTFPGFEKKFIFITGGIFTEETKEFLKGIPNLCLEKPFEFAELFEAVAQFTGKPSK